MSIVSCYEDVGGTNDEGMDPKTALNQYCQRYCSRPVTKTDVVYTSTKYGFSQYQAIVKLNCMQGQEYAGEVSATPKEAEKSAANQALEAYRMVSLPEPGSKKKKSPGVVDPETGELVEPEDCWDKSALTDKVLLNATCMKIAKRTLVKGDTVYQSQLVRSAQVPMFLCSVCLLCLPEPWSEMVFEGEACTNKQAASQSAAKVALEAIMADAKLCELASSKPPVTSGGKGKGKGFKGKFLSAKGWSDLMSGPDLPREMVTEVSVTGEVLEWKGYFGWLKPDEELDHPAAALRGGRVYVHQQDLEDQLQELQANARVRFQVYCDPSGLGATQVTLC